MGYVHPDRPDLFVSYAHADDQLDPVKKDQWVSKLVGALEIRLKERLSDEVDIWRDRTDLAGNAPLTDALDRDVGRSATLLVVLSHRYLGSEWTRREREVFQKVVADREWTPPLNNLSTQLQKIRNSASRQDPITLRKDIDGMYNSCFRCHAANAPVKYD